MAAFLVRALDLPAATKDYFTDDDGSSLESAINAMAAAGLTSGCGDRRYCPGSRGHPRADGRLPAASVQAQLTRGRVGRPHRTPPDRPVPVMIGTFVGLPVPVDAGVWLRTPPPEDVLKFVRRRSASTLLAVLLLATSVIPARPRVRPPTGARATLGAAHRRRPSSRRSPSDRSRPPPQHPLGRGPGARERQDRFRPGRPSDRPVPPPRPRSLDRRWRRSPRAAGGTPLRVASCATP